MTGEDGYADDERDRKHTMRMVSILFAVFVTAFMCIGLWWLADLDVDVDGYFGRGGD